MFSLYRCKHSSIALLFPAPAIAAGCVYRVLISMGMKILEQRTTGGADASAEERKSGGGREEWIHAVAGRGKGKVDLEDFEDVLAALEKVDEGTRKREE